jgi:hypothetical protein
VITKTNSPRNSFVLNDERIGRKFSSEPVDSPRLIRYIHKAVEASGAKVLLRATSEPRKIYIVLRDRIASTICKCNSKRVEVLNNRDDESD